jgi:hypothetical protein
MCGVNVAWVQCGMGGNQNPVDNTRDRMEGWGLALPKFSHEVDLGSLLVGLPKRLFLTSTLTLI